MKEDGAASLWYPTSRTKSSDRTSSPWPLAQRSLVPVLEALGAPGPCPFLAPLPGRNFCFLNTHLSTPWHSSSVRAGRALACPGAPQASLPSSAGVSPPPSSTSDAVGRAVALGRSPGRSPLHSAPWNPVLAAAAGGLSVRSRHQQHAGFGALRPVDPSRVPSSKTAASHRSRRERHQTPRAGRRPQPLTLPALRNKFAEQNAPLGTSTLTNASVSLTHTKFGPTDTC